MLATVPPGFVCDVRVQRLHLGRWLIEILQEVWLGNEELVDMYEKRLGDAGYISFKLPRTNNRGDGAFEFLPLVRIWFGL